MKTDFKKELFDSNTLGKENFASGVLSIYCALPLLLQGLFLCCFYQKEYESSWLKVCARKTKKIFFCFVELKVF